METKHIPVKNPRTYYRKLRNSLLLAGVFFLPLTTYAGAISTFTASNQTLTVSGSAATLASGTEYFVGNGFTQDTLSITNGGTLVSASNSQYFTVGAAVTDVGNAITVDGAGSTLTINGSFTFGVRAGLNSITISNGGTLSSSWGMGIGKYGTSGTNTITITGSNSLWNSANLNLNAGGGNTISALAGGKLANSGYLYIGNFSSSNVVTVSGSGSVINQTNGFVVVGNTNSGAGISNSNALVIGAGATMNVTSTGTYNNGINIVGVTGATGNKVQIDGGTLTLTVTGSGTSAINVQNGALILNSGSVTTPVLLANTGATSVIQFNGGTLKTGSTAIANGSVFTVGNGTSLASLVLNGGNHSFANGIALSNNAGMSGSGTVTGAVTNSGTIAGNVTFNSDVTVNSGGAVTGGTFNANVTDNGAISSALNILSGKTLNGTGVVSGAVVNSGTIAGSLTFNNDVTVNSGATVTGGIFNANLTDNGTISTDFSIFSGKTLNGTGIVNGAVVNSGTIAGSLTFNNDVTVNSGATAEASAFNGNVVANGVITSAVNVQSGKVLSGTGSVTKSVTVLSGGKTSAGNGASTGKLSLDLTYNSGAAANFNVSSSSNNSGLTTHTSGLSYSQVIVTGSAGVVNLQIGAGTATAQRQADGSSNSGVALEVSLSLSDFNALVASAAQNYVPGGANSSLDNLFLFSLGSGLSAGEFETLVMNIGGTIYSGTIYYSGANDVYDGTANLGYVTVNGQEFAVSYTGDSTANSTIGGNDIVLTAVPEPSTWAILVGATGMLLGCQRIRRRSA